MIHHVQEKFYIVGLLIRKCSNLQLPELGQNKVCFVIYHIRLGKVGCGQLAIHSQHRAYCLDSARDRHIWDCGGLMIVATPVSKGWSYCSVVIHYPLQCEHSCETS
jgi:hypothetical protein